jgi:uncharacterized protein (DUF1697 family)
MLAALFLRRINVTGSRMTMNDLRDTLAYAGFPDIETVRASGNAIVRSDTYPDRAHIEKVIEERHGFFSETFIRSEEELRAVVSKNPFLQAAGKVEVAFLQEEPTRAVIEDVLALPSGNDTLEIVNREIYWLRPLPLEESYPSERHLRAALGVDSTRRTMGTVELMLGAMDRMNV